MKRIDLTLILGMFFAIILTSFAGIAAEADEIRSQVLRLHILAHSDDENAQQLKYAVRDRILAEGAHVFAGEDFSAARALALQELPRFEHLAQEIITEFGYTYTASAGLVNMHFDTSFYYSAATPAGMYDAVRITIGDGSGQNWWCVMFPPLCLPAASGEAGADVRRSLYQLGEQRYTPRFAVVEFVEDLRNRVQNTVDS